MRKFSLLFSILFLCISMSFAYAAEVKLEDTSTASDKQISLSVDTKEETTDTIKIVLQSSEDVTISDVLEGGFDCSTFSSVPNKNTAEIICTFSSPKAVSGKLADIKFTSTAESYNFTVDENQSKIGELEIDNVVNIGDMQTEQPIATTTDDTTTNQETTETKAPTTSQTTTKKTTGFMAFLPYILLGAAGIFLISIIILLVSKKKDNVASNTTPLPSSEAQAPVVPSLINTQQPPVETPVQQPMTESTQTTTPQISESKPTLAELVGATPEISTETPPIQSVGLESKEQTDLEALLKSENPGINTTPQEQIVSTPTLENIPITENNESTNVENPSTEVPSGYSANISTGGLPEVGSTSPLENSYQTPPSTTTTDQPVQYTSNAIPEVENPSLNPDLNQNPLPTPDISAQQINQPIDTPPTVDPDLQNIINQEINNIQANPLPTPEQPQNPIPTTSTTNPM